MRLVWWVSESDAAVPADDDHDRFLGAFTTRATARAYIAERRRQTAGSRIVHLDRYVLGELQWAGDFFQVDA